MKTFLRNSLIQSMLTAVFALPCLSASAQTASGDPIKIGFSTELTGAWTFFGTSCVAGLKMAVDEINSKGGVLKRPLEFIVQDNQTNPTQALASVRNFDVNDKVLAISGTTNSDVSLAMYGYAEQNKVPFLIPVAAFPQLTKPGTKYSFRIEPDAVGWGYSMAKFIEQRKPGATVALMYSDAALMRAIFAGFKYQADKSKLKVVSDIVFPQGSSDATVQAAQVKAANPDFVIVSGAGAFDAVLNNQVLDLGIKPEQIIHPFGITTQVFNWGSKSVGSIYGTFFDQEVDNLPKEGRDFIAKYDAANSRPPSYVENYCYNTPYIFKSAIESAGVVDREKLRDAFSKMNIKELTSGTPIHFDANGARKEYMYFMQIVSVDGKRNYKSKQLSYFEWNPEVIPVYELVK